MKMAILRFGKERIKESSKGAALAMERRLLKSKEKLKN